jgi:plasmid stabilization system protein ParE
VKLEWSAAALADLDRFAAFLHDRHPQLAAIVAREILAKAKLLESSPEIGTPIGSSAVYRQVVLQILRARYVFRYRIAEDRVVMLRVLHGRERR